ncbi:Heat shock protein 17.4, related [Neospora caninum Liverpool]|uniref:Heat shock protein 17.4, related n=1 Tax=Neospora caninum (strain Liverpool) TaxID=572307 RepID=F0VD85_NEOCL|nr:Heat shock protein 17.4, related [Neospora caninum Liverpool]CBZ51600.1 Heat shock protein 17.4, related [Neospora caninum Liverpool]CEL65551.1 TPA: Heat shock protein 17.4, related [Neospora caninum Liverpool]|eukprot:XP_003881633.1 Heat shock protein 17.4, related [Neospora caninum Liverpool]
MSSSSGSSADSSRPQEGQRQGQEGAGLPRQHHGDEYLVRSNPLLVPSIMPQLSTMDRLYAEMMDDMSRIHHEMNRFYHQHFNSVAPFMQGAQPQACEGRPWWRPSSWFQRNASHAPMALERGSHPEVNDLRGGQMVPASGGQEPASAAPWDVMPFGWGSRGGLSTGSMPRVDMRDTGAEFVVQADVPGMDRENLRVDVHDGVLRISGAQREEKKQQEEGFYLQERSQSSFSRSFILPEKVKEDEIKASLTNGVLQVHVPKETPTEPPAIRNITIE